jgi:hypothetical protein
LFRRLRRVECRPRQFRREPVNVPECNRSCDFDSPGRETPCSLSGCDSRRDRSRDAIPHAEATADRERTSPPDPD